MTLKRRHQTAAVTGGIWTLIMLGRLFMGGAVGMADQGDSRRLMCQLGVRAARPFGADTTQYITTTWLSHRWYGEACGADGSGEPYRSSQLLVLRVARALTPILHLPGALDLRVVGMLAAVVVGTVVGVLVLLVPGPIWFRLIVASLVGLAAADAAVAEYFISAYSEPAALLGILALCAALLWLWRDGYTTWPRLIVVATVAVFTMTAKTQVVALLPAVVLGIVFLPHKGMEGLAARWPAVFTGGVLVVASGAYLLGSPQRFNQINAYDQVFLEILPHSHEPAADLRALGVDPSLASADGANILDARSAAVHPQYLQFRNHVNQVTILRFYATHPTRLPAVAAQGLRAVTVWREDYLGTYTPASGRQPGARECRVCIYTGIFNTAEHAPITVPLLWLFTLLGGMTLTRNLDFSAHEKALGRLAIVISVGAFCEFWAVMLSEGASDLYKHMIFTNLLTALCLPLLAGCIWLLMSSANISEETEAEAVLAVAPDGARPRADRDLEGVLPGSWRLTPSRSGRWQVSVGWFSGSRGT